MFNIIKKFQHVFCEDCEHCSDREDTEYAKCLKSPRLKLLTHTSREKNERMKNKPRDYYYCDTQRWLRFCWKYKKHEGGNDEV